MTYVALDDIDIGEVTNNACGGGGGRALVSAIQTSTERRAHTMASTFTTGLYAAKL